MDGLLTHLAPLRRRPLGKGLDLWCSTRAEAGMDVEAELRARVDGATMALVFLSPAFLAERHDLLVRLEASAAKGLRVIPVLARPTTLVFNSAKQHADGAWIAQRQPLPANGVPLSVASNLDEAMCEVAGGIARIIERASNDTDVTPRASGTRSPEVVRVQETLDALAPYEDLRADLYREMFSLCGPYQAGQSSADLAHRVLGKLKADAAVAKICAWKMRRLPSAQFETVLFRASIPTQFLSGRSAPQSDRVYEAVAYMESQGRIDDLVTVLGGR